MLRRSYLLIPSALLVVSFAQAQEVELQDAQTIEPIFFQKDEIDTSGRSLMLKDEDGRRFHAGIRLGLGYDTNAYSQRHEDKEAPNGSFTFKIRPSLSLNGKGKLAKLNLGAAADTGVIFGPSQNTRFMLLSGTVAAGGEINSEGMASMFANAKVDTSREVETLFLSSLTQLQSDFAFGGSVRPGDGVITLVGDANAKNETFFDVDQPVVGKFADDPAKLDNQSYYLHGKISWEFLKDKNFFVNAKSGTWLGKDESIAVTVNPLWINAGVAGLIAPNVKGLLSAGYANTFIRLIPSNTLLEGNSLALSAQADLDWRISDESSLSLKFQRDLAPSPIFLERFTNLIAADFRQKFAEDFTLVLAPSFKLYEYGKALTADKSARLAGNARRDIVLGLREELMYFVQDWFSVGFSHEGTFRWSNAKDVRVHTADGKMADPAGSFMSQNEKNDFLLFAAFYY